jgi:dynein heavy chain
MDERHWWFATKLQETFHIGAQDSPTMLEDFMAEQATLDYINDFIAIGGHTKLFFYCPKPSQETLVARKMSVTNTTAKLREVLNEESICLYFLRSEADHVIESNRVEKEVFCGEIKEGPLLTLNLLVSDIFAPILRAQKNWDCSDENVAQFLTQFEKLASTLNEYATASVAPQPILKRAEMQVSNDFKQNRAAAINPMVLSEYETLVTDWMHTIEGILCDGLDDRYSIIRYSRTCLIWTSKCLY